MSNFELGHPRVDLASKPFSSSTSLAIRLGSVFDSVLRVTIALGSSNPKDKRPRGRWRLNDRPTMWMSFASMAEASVSPAKPM